MDNYLKKYPDETEFPRINVTTFNKAPSLNKFTLMWANRNTYEIGFNTHRRSVGLIAPVKKPSPFDMLKSALVKIQNGNLLDFEEEYALESFYHEINHTKAKKWASLKPHGAGDYKRTAMETINQFVSRHDYVYFIKNMGGRANNQEKVLDEGGGYRCWVKTLREFIKAKKLNELKVLSNFRDKLLNGRYDELDSVLYDFFKKYSGTNKSQDEVLCAFETMNKPDSFIKFLESNNNNQSP